MSNSNEKCKKQKKINQLENLENLVENHTRTERHLEQYSHIGNRDNIENSRYKQEDREEQIEDLKNKIIGENQNESKEEQAQNIVKNYISTDKYIENNFDNIPSDALNNLNKKQHNRRIQLENLEENQRKF